MFSVVHLLRRVQARVEHVHPHVDHQFKVCYVSSVIYSIKDFYIALRYNKKCAMFLQMQFLMLQRCHHAEQLTVGLLVIFTAGGYRLI